MKSLLGGLRNASPVPLSSARTLSLIAPSRAGRETYLSAFGEVGVLGAIVDRLANATSQVRWHLYRKSRTGLDLDRIEVPDHLALTLWRKPNPFFTGQEFIETFQQHLELVGEAWWIVARRPGVSIPLELWPVRPDRMSPVPDPHDYISGYIYTAPDGTPIPLKLDEVIFLRRPNPMDMYRGIGPVQSVMVDLNAAKYSAEWNLNFFRNGAEPGGIIEVPTRLSDPEFDQMRDRWREQHQGVANAHRVAILEEAKYIPMSITQRDMQFAELSSLSDEKIRQAFSFPKPLLGSVDDVNRANAEAAEVVFSRWLITPRLERIKGALNNDYLPMFAGGDTLEFDYESPVPDDREALDRERDSRVNAVKLLVEAGYDPAEVLDYLELPPMQHVVIAPPAAPALRALPAAHGHLAITAATEDDAPDLPSLEELQAEYDAALDALVADFEPVLEQWRTSLTEQVRDTVDTGEPDDLTQLSVSTDDGAEVIGTAMLALALLAAASVVAEAASQGVSVKTGKPDADALDIVARATTSYLGTELSISAGREALRQWGTGSTGLQVGDAVREYLDGLTYAGVRASFVAMLTRAQAAGRMATLLLAPTARYYASEELDKSTCKPCRKVNEELLGTDLDEVQRLYPTGGYIHCEGRERCRGFVVPIWTV